MSVNKVQLANGETIIDISDSTVAPETLAEGVTAHDASGQKITGKMVPGGGSSVQSDWNQTDETAPDFLKNKPFGEFVGDTVTWTLTPDQLAEDNLVGGMLAKVSDAVITMNDLEQGAVFYTPFLGEAIDIPAEGFAPIVEGLILSPDLFIVFVDTQAVGVDIEGMTFPEVGVYSHTDYTVGVLTIHGFDNFVRTEKMDGKYLPDTCVQQKELWVGVDNNGVNRVYADSAKTELIPIEVLYSLIDTRTQAVIISTSAISVAVSVSAGGNIGYLDETGAYTVAYAEGVTP